MHRPMWLPMLLLASAASTPVVAGPSLEDQFRNPPQAARAQVWWHWMNGNIDADEAVADIEWMADQAIGGIHLFEGGLGAPKQIAELKPWMSPAWQDAMRKSVQRAHERGMDFSIATSPGWSATGAPFVQPADAMKKLVWSETVVRGDGGKMPIRLARPPVVEGAYQDVPLTKGAGADFYRDVAVIAFPGSRTILKADNIASSSVISAERLADGRFDEPQDLLPDTDGIGWIIYRFARPETVRSIRIGMPAAAGFGAPAPPVARLEVSDDGLTYRNVTTVYASKSPVRTASFPAVSGRYFRMAIAPDAQGEGARLNYAPGAIPLSFPPQKQAYAVSELLLSPAGLIQNAEEKAGFAAVPDYYARATHTDGPSIDPASIIDLTPRLGPDGTLDWIPPGKGAWTVLRFGMSLTGHRNGPAPAEATGLEVDKLSASRVGAYIDRYLADQRAALKGVVGLNGLLSDSIEAGAQNWTDDMPSQFRNRTGYALDRWYPALAGYIVGKPAQSDAFLYDFRRTISDLLTEAHYGTLAARAKAAGLTYYAEALEDNRPQLGNDLAIRAKADVPAGAMWWFDPSTGPKPTYVADVKGAASVAHILGKPYIAVEALTVFGRPWGLSPADMRPAADLAFLMGGNRLMLHSSVHQGTGSNLVSGQFPGMTMAPLLGHYFNRNDAWGDMAKGWTDYLARTQFLLQQGRPQAGFAWFVGEEAPVTGLFGGKEPEGVPSGLDYDFIDATLLASGLAVQDGKLINRSGNSYQFLFLGGSSARLTLATLNRLLAFARQGVAIAGVRPVDSPSLADDPKAVAKAIATLWALPHVVEADTPEAAAKSLRVALDWRFTGQGLSVLHRVLPDGDIYFLVNRGSAHVEGDFQIPAKAVTTWWDAVDGSQVDAGAKAGAVHVALAPHQSRFLVARDLASAKAVAPIDPVSVVTADDRWHVSLATPGLATDERRAFSLHWLNEQSDPRLRYFSGKATYTGTIRLPKPSCARPVFRLDLGAMADVARVTVNGIEAGMIWTQPHRVNVSAMIRAGRNRLKIEVANLWVNRLIGEAAHNPSSAGAKMYRPDAPLRSAGLKGPVRLFTHCEP
ncbi:glycosyl hydrolase [Sphingobium sp. HBC34]|uniref:Glycosyl hydrolase n=1 Tax=Sphingobium cyanobacteriorum TaxID=3063954 RepID=A0ABT8ZJE2_9SPHN|nr:glycosyl hydrolase [Sphingobium sp. HBC34]MDO7834144.1 glycosyl hydrolase [Sphingobium sp. HBC34]